MVQCLVDYQTPRFTMTTRKNQHIRCMVEPTEVLLMLKADLPDFNFRLAVAQSLQVVTQLSVANRQDYAPLTNIAWKTLYCLNDLVRSLARTQFSGECNYQAVVSNSQFSTRRGP